MSQKYSESVEGDPEWKAFMARLNRPAQERIDELVKDGIIDRDGNVLIRMPIFGPDEEEAQENGEE